MIQNPEKIRQREIQKQNIVLVKDKESKQAEIFRSLTQIIQNKKVVLAYRAIQFEVNLDSVLDSLNQDIKIYYPRVAGSKLEFVCPDSWRSGKFSIQEPVGERVISLDKADFCIVPSLGFNRNGYRLGRGGGYYDRTLEGFSVEKIIGLSFWENFPVEFQEESHDIRVSKLITDKEVIFFKN
ncbi:MAG: 5-formyltetrahydrofolate cyclo-ligase [Leptospiraceae bacterium]|nr:5-formyltetrahydrofolate cyclo-ligase [Leptospiraceae bacterium]MCK6380991.1 5-formyltetrahydrofolate cyclo-ligase [Leptospiraceae bacterium]NUM40256.1 5-formyltetrahydrofolate cyclo-ligase [Leptospiraceae bacterium]